MNRFLVIITSLMLFSLSSIQAQTLESLFAVAAENNPGLKASYKEFEAALEKVPQASTLSDPTFSIGYFISPVETRVGPQRARLSLSQMFPWFGTLKAQGDAATLMADAKYQSFLDARNRLYYRIAAAYYSLYELSQWQRIEQENVAILESYKNIATRQFENGNAPMTDVLRVDIMLKDAVTNLEILHLKEKSILTSLNLLLNRDQSTVVSVQDSLFIPAKIYERENLFNDNPKLRELDYRASASEASETAATKQGLPKLGLGLDYVIVGKGDMDVPDNGKDAIMPMVSVSLPIFRARYKAAIKEAQLMQESYGLQKENYTNTLIGEYETLIFQLSQQEVLIQLYQNQVLESNRVLNLLFSAYSNTGKDFEELLRMQQQLLKYERQEATALTEYHVRLAELNYITAKNYDHDNQ